MEKVAILKIDPAPESCIDCRWFSANIEGELEGKQSAGLEGFCKIESGSISWDEAFAFPTFCPLKINDNEAVLTIPAPDNCLSCVLGHRWFLSEGTCCIGLREKPSGYEPVFFQSYMRPYKRADFCPLIIT